MGTIEIKVTAEPTAEGLAEAGSELRKLGDVLLQLGAVKQGVAAAGGGTSLRPDNAPPEDPEEAEEPEEVEEAEEVEVDKSGVPWDERIHSNAANRMAKTGFWKRRKGVDDDTFEEVMAELREREEKKAMAAAGAADPEDPEEAEEPDAGAGDPPAKAEAPAVDADEITFPKLSVFLQNAQTNGQLTREEIQNICTEFGLKNQFEIIRNKELIPAFYATAYELWLSKGNTPA